MMWLGFLLDRKIPPVTSRHLLIMQYESKYLSYLCLDNLNPKGSWNALALSWF